MSNILNYKPSITETFSGDGSVKEFTLSYNPANNEIKEAIGVAISDFSLSDNKIVFTTAPSGSFSVEYDYWTSLSVVKGDDGKSAYQAAKEAGYTGTEAAFNASLAGVAGKQNAITTVGILKGTGNGNVTVATAETDYATINSNVASATKLKTARTITIGSASNKTFDGSTDISYTLAEIGAAPTTHSQSASTISAGTLGGTVTANATSVANLATKQVRNIYAGTTDMVAGTTALSSGDIYIYYE